MQYLVNTVKVMCRQTVKLLFWWGLKPDHNIRLNFLIFYPIEL